MIIDRKHTPTIDTWKAKIIEKEHIKEILDAITDDIKRYELDCRFADYSQTDECTICNKNVFGSIYKIIDKYMQEVME